jgi:hypothetical protein
VLEIDIRPNVCRSKKKRSTKGVFVSLLRGGKATALMGGP